MENQNRNKFNSNAGPPSGRIGRLDEQTLGYYRRVSESLKDDFDSVEDKELFINNVFNQLITEAVKVSQNQTASRIVEDLLYQANANQLKSFMEVFAKDWETVSTDRFASHVTQSLVLLTAQHYKKKDEVALAMKDMFGELYQCLMSQLGMHMQHTYSSHIVRAVIEVLGGVRVDNSIVRSRSTKAFSKEKSAKDAIELPQPGKKFRAWLDDIGHKIMAFPKLKEFAKNYLSNPVLQTLLLVQVARNPTTASSIVRSLIAATDMLVCEGDAVVPDLVSDEVSSHLVEQILKSASEELQSEIYTQHLKGKLIHLAMHRTANFVLQTFIKSIKSSEQFEAVFCELADDLEDVLAENHLGVIVSLAEAASTHGTKQKSLIKALQKAFHCHEPEERQSKLVPLLASLTTYDVFYKVPDSEDDASGDDSDEEFELPTLKTINYHGSCLLQKLLHFGNPKPILSSLLDLKPVELQTLACDPCGSHVVEELVKSSTVGDKSREAFYNRLKGFYLDIACHKNGSRTLDSMWNAAPLKQRITLAEELCKHESQLRGHRFGKFIWRNYALHHFLHRRNEWKDIQNGQLKKRKLFQELIGPEAGQSATKKVKASKEEDDAAAMRLQSSDEEEDEEKPTAAASLTKKKKKQKKIHRELENNESKTEVTDATFDTSIKKKKKKKAKTDKTEMIKDSVDKSEVVKDNLVKEKHKKKKKEKGLK